MHAVCFKYQQTEAEIHKYPSVFLSKLGAYWAPEKQKAGAHGNFK